MELDALDADAVRRWSGLALRALQRHEAEIDALNVFPVPDGDTGTNLVLTLAEADAAVRASADPTAGEALQTFARAAVLGARGNSGVIMAQLLVGIAEAARGRGHADAEAVGAGLRLGAKHALLAVAAPAPGTVLTVAQAVADSVVDGSTLGQCMRQAVAVADAALARTVDQLPALRAAGVVDAGARGYVLVLDALATVVTGAPVSTAPVSTNRAPVHLPQQAGAVAYEVQYLLEADGDPAAALRSELTRVGDSVAVVGTGDGVWNVHVHTDDAGAAVEAGLRLGRPQRISVVPLDLAAGGTRRRSGRAVVAVCPGRGLEHLFAGEGVHVVASASGEATDVDDVLAAVRAAHVGEMVLLPGPTAVKAAEAAAERARRDGVRVAVVPTRSPVQAVSAVAVHDVGRSFDDDVVAMAEAAAATRFAEVTVADQEALTSVGVCSPGDVLGLIDGDVVEIGHGVLSVALALTDRLVAVGADLLTVLISSEVGAGTGGVIEAHVRGRSPLTEVAVLAAGNLDRPVIIGVE